MSSITSALVNTNNEFNQAVAKQKGSALDKDAFMLLLVTQFKYQDPLNPMEDKEFISQLSQFSSLEQLMNLNTSMEGLNTSTQQQQMINATSYIGKSVDAGGSTISKMTDATTNNTSVTNFRYAIGESMVGGSILVYDGSNQLVNQYEAGPQLAGTYDFQWDGQGFNGNAPDGVYRIVLNFKNAENATLQYDAVVAGKVTGVLTEGSVTYLTLDDGRNLPLANVRRVTDTSVNSNTNTNTDTNTTNTNTNTNTNTSTDTLTTGNAA